MPTYTLTGPTTGVQQVASSNFTVTADATAITGSVVVTPNDGGKGGTFTPATVSLTAANQAKTFTYTPKVTGAATISATNNAGYTNPAPLTYTASLNKDVAINQILLAHFKNTGNRFDINQLVRDGGMSNADALALRDSFDTFYKNSMDAAPRVIHKPDLASQIGRVDSTGRSGRGGGDINADKASTINTTTQSGRANNKSTTGGDKPGGTTTTTGR